MIRSNFKSALALVAASGLAVSGCSSPGRLPAVPVASIPQTSQALGSVRYLVTRESKTFADDAKAALLREQQWLQSKGVQTTNGMPPAYFLAISGGGDNGAYGSGFLNGWTAAGTRPEFKVVTGISTGALIAPFAFLGPKYDHVLREVYTNTSQKDIFRKRGMLKGLFGEAMTDTRPLASLIEKYVTRQFLDEVAAEYGKGRILLVGTTNLDSLEPVIWNMTEIAGSKDPKAITLFRRLLLASASIPGAFPPVMIDLTIDGKSYQEMHVDGGTMTQVFLYPPSVSFSGMPQRKRVLYVIRNARLDPDWASTDRRTMTIAMRAIESLTMTQGVGDLYRIYATTERDGIDFNLTYIPPTFNTVRREQFDTQYMRALYDVGFEAAKQGYQWEKYPPGFSAPLNAQGQ
ncbi:patatin family protein [Sphingomonas sp. HDW15A]|uniref:patatin-like phospholipase family protein n=1 Tax=Sphingomonas sp. HDW15A TaxID=2714942 RepID=UPI001408B15B|nr:patatin-like phospholipase family protein [Sphingomonas sp. HDW15A]QIK95368.1 patatin family protein [Sphingomonas sp. HDW15A]